MRILKKLYRVLPVAIALLLSGCGSTNPNSPTNFNTNVAPTAIQAAALCPSTNPSFAGGDGSVGNPYQISQFCHFYAYSANPSYWALHTQMTADLDLTGIGFAPMIALTGTFEGNGHVISNWASGVALFVTNGGTIRNVNLVNVTMVPLGSSRPAPLVGTNLAAGNVTNCTTSGSVNGLAAANLNSDNDIYWFVGGLVSINFGTVTHSSSSVNVIGLQAIGGLVGHNEGTIRTSHASGTVHATTSGSNFGVGGLAGNNIGGSILNSYATGLVQGVAQVGGLLGYSTGPVQNCYSSGAVNGTGANIGGLIGQNTGGAISNSFWDTVTSGQAASSGGTGQATAAMQSVGTFTGWDFAGTWNAPSGSYPSLR